MSNKEHDNHDDVELSNMIQEYASDDSLRNKIEALKKEKEKVSQQMECEKPQDIQEEFIKEDHEDEEAVEKTRVVLSSASSTVDQQDQTMIFHDLTQNTIDRKQDDDILHDEDMEEFLSEDSRSKEERDKKVNKMITGVVAGLACLCLIGLGVLGYQLTKGPSEHKEVASGTQNHVNKDKDKNNKDKETVDKNKEEDTKPKEEAGEKQPVKPDNSTEIAGLRGQIKAYEEQVAEKKNDLQDAKAQLDGAKSELSSLETELSKTQEEKRKLEQLGGIDNKELIQELEKKIISLEAKKKEVIQKESAARALIDEINSSISDLNSKITDLQGQLNKLL